MKTVIKSENLFYIYISIVILFSSWTIYYRLPFHNLFFAVSSLLILFRYNFTFQRSNLIFCCFFGIVIVRYYLPFDISIYDRQFYYSFVQMFFLMTIFLIPKTELYKVYNLFINLFLIILCIGLIMHIFHILGFPLLTNITIYTTSIGRSFVVYLTHSNQIIYGVEDIYRFSSIFDEPGYLGTIIAFILCIERYDLVKTKNKLLVFAGIMTVSGSFFFLTSIYFILHFVYFVYLKKINFYGRRLLIVIFLILFISSVFPELYDMFAKRLVFVSGEGFEDKRLNASQFLLYWNFIQNLNSNVLLWGAGRYAEPLQFGIFMSHVSWVHLVVRIGMILLAYMSILLLFFSIKLKNFNFFSFSFVFLIAATYRPEIFTPIYMFLLICAYLQINDLKESVDSDKKLRSHIKLRKTLKFNENLNA